MKALIILILAIFVGILLVLLDPFVLFLVGVIVMVAGYYLTGGSWGFGCSRYAHVGVSGKSPAPMFTEIPKEEDDASHNSKVDESNLDLRIIICGTGFAYLCIALIYWMIFP